MRRLKADLTVNGIDNLIKELEDYRDGLDAKCEEFVKRLLDIGITRAESVGGISGTFGTHKMENYVYYTKEFEQSIDGYVGFIVGVGTEFDVTWGAHDEKHGSLNALKALEFGTAGLALPPTNMFGVTGGQGTNSQYGHANDTEWYFLERDANGKVVRHTATAITPTRPMLNAAEEVIKQINKVAKEVFRQ